MLSDCRRVPRLLIFPLIPFILMVAIDSDLFFLILLLFCLWFGFGLLFISQFVSDRMLGGCVLVCCPFADGCWGLFLSIVWVPGFGGWSTATGVFSPFSILWLSTLVFFGASSGWYVTVVVGPKVIFFLFLRLLFMGSYLYLFAFMRISIAESSSSDVILSRRLLFWSGLGVLSLLLDWSRGLSGVVCLEGCFFLFSRSCLSFCWVWWVGSVLVLYFFLSWEWDGVLSGLLRFGVEWLLGLFFLMHCLLRSISARGDLDLVLWSCLWGSGLQLLLGLLLSLSSRSVSSVYLLVLLNGLL